MIRKLLFAILLLFSTPLFAQDYFEVTTTELNVRDEGGKSGNVIGKLSKGDRVKVISKDGSWYNVELSDGQVGYASSKFLTAADGSSSTSSSSGSKKKSSPWTSALIIGAIVVYGLYKLGNKSSGSSLGSRSTSSARPAPKSKPSHWYFCNHCGEKIQATKQPTTLNCSRSTFHRWTDLGEVGDRNFNCQHCGTTIWTTKSPTTLNCSASTFHRWTEL